MLEVHFAHDASCSKHIRVEVIMVGSEDTFRSSIPSGGHVRSVGPTFNGEVLACAKIYDLCDERVLVDHNIVWL